MTQYNSNFDGTYPFSDTAVRMQLATNTALSWTVPGNLTQKYRAKFRFSSSAEIWVSYNGTAVSPTAGTATDSYNQEMLPWDECRYVHGGDVLSFIATTGTPQVGVSLLVVQN